MTIREARRSFRKCSDLSTVLHTLPRLVRAMQWVAILSKSEAAACIRDYRAGRAFSGGAVNHYGGTHKVLRHAWEWRGQVREVLRARAEYNEYSAT